MDEKLILNDDTEIQGHLIETESRLFLYMYNITLAEAFNLLIDPEKTETIRWERYGETGTIEGYRKLMSMSVEMNDMICASLKKQQPEEAVRIV